MGSIFAEVLVLWFEHIFEDLFEHLFGDVLVLGAFDPSAEGGLDLGPAGTPGTVPGRDLHDGTGGGRGGLGDVEL